MFLRQVLGLVLFAALVLCAGELFAQPLAVWPSPRAVVEDVDGVMRFDVVVVNMGTETALDVVVVDGLAPGAELVEAAPMPVFDGDRLVWSLGQLPPGGSASISLATRGGLDTGARVSGVLAGSERRAEALAAFGFDGPEELAVALAPTLDANARDAEVLAVVGRLNGDPLALVEHVRSKISYEVYSGSLRGARGTLWSGAGNALDQSSLLVALLRAAGFPARYAMKQLDVAAAGRLIASIFSPSNRMISPIPDVDELAAIALDQDLLRTHFGPEFANFVAENEELVLANLHPDPSADEALLAEASEHFFVQVFRDGAWQAFDVALGEEAPEADGIFVEVDDSLRHRVEVSLVAEVVNPAFGIDLQASGRQTLSAELRSVELVGQPIGIRFEVQSDTRAGLVFSVIENTYIPVLEVGGRERARGEAVSELMTNFPAGSQVLTGLFVDIDLEEPDGERTSHRHSVIDRFGAAIRDPGPRSHTIELEGLTGAPALTPQDVVAIHVASSRVPRRAALAHSAKMGGDIQRVQALAPVFDELFEKGLEGPLSTAERRIIDENHEAFTGVMMDLATSIGLDYFQQSDRASDALAEYLLVKAWPARPRILATSVRVGPGGPAPRVDVVDDGLRVLSPVHVGGPPRRFFRTTRGMMLSTLEGQVLGPYMRDGGALVSVETVFAAAQAQGIMVRTFAFDNVFDLQRLDLPEEAYARIHRAIADGRIVLTPEAPVSLGEAEHLVWMEFDPLTGDLISVGVDGARPAAIEYANLLDRMMGFATGLIIGGTVGFYVGVMATGIQAIERLSKGEKIEPFADLEPLTCIAAVIPGIGTFTPGLIPGNSIYGALKRGEVASTFFKAGVLASYESLVQQFGRQFAGTVGIGAMAAGLRVGMCVGFMAGQRAVAFLLQGLDPPLEVIGTAMSAPLRQTIHIDRRGVTLLAEPLRQPPERFDRLAPLRVRGAFSAEWEGQAQVELGQLAAEGTLSDSDGEVGEGPVVATIEWARLTGSFTTTGRGSLTRYAAETGGHLEQVELRGEGLTMEFMGVVEGRPESQLYRLEGASVLFSGEGDVLFPEVGTLEAEGASVGLASEAFAEVSGVLRLDGDAEIDAVAGVSLRLADLPAELEVNRGEVLRVPVSLTASESGEATLGAEGPEGWDLSFDGDELVVVQAAGAPAGAHHVYVHGQLQGLPEAVAAAVITVVVRDGEGASMDLVFNEILTQTDGEHQVPLVFEARITHHGGQAQIYDLSADAGEGFTAPLAQQRVALVPGERGQVFFAVTPTDAPPPPGTPLTIRVEARVEGAVVSEASLVWPYPEVYGARARFEPSLVRLERGEETTVTLVLESGGNTSGTSTVTVEDLASVDLSGVPAEVEVVPGETLSFAVQVRLEDTAVLGLDHVMGLHTRRGAVVEGAAMLGVRAVGVDANAAVCAAEIADGTGDVGLRDVLIGVSDRLERLSFRCDDRGIISLRSTLEALAVELDDPVFDEVRRGVIEFYEPLALEVGCQNIDLSTFEVLIVQIKRLLEALRDHDFHLSLTPEAHLATPGETVSFALDIERLGGSDTLYEVEVVGILASVESPLDPSPRVEGHPIVVEAQGRGRQPFVVRVAPVAAPHLVREVSGLVVVEEEWVGFGRVGADPPFALRGAMLRVEASLFNIMNIPLDVEATVEVRRPDQTLLYTSPEPVPLRLPVSESLRLYELGIVRTFEEPAGDYGIEVTLRLPGSQELIPGGRGVGVALIGKALDATVVVEPELLPPGDVRTTVRIEALRRPLNILPGVANPIEIQRFATDMAGPAGLWGHSDGSVYFTSFGTERSSDIPGYEAGRTVGRISPFGEVSVLATVAPAVAALTLGPDGALYAANVGNPEQVTRVELPGGETSIYHHFENVPIQGGGGGENVTGLVFDQAGNLYATELIEAGLFVTYPGERIYRLTPDENDDGLPDLVETFVTGLNKPSHITIDPRTQDLFVCDTGSQRVMRVNTLGGEPVAQSVAEDFNICSGVYFDETGNFYALRDVAGQLNVWATEVVDGHTALVGEPKTVLGGLRAPYNLTRTAAGHFVTALTDDDMVLRILTQEQRPAPQIGLEVSHRTAHAGVDQDSAQPNLGDDGPVWQEGQVDWRLTLAPEDEGEGFSLGHDIAGGVAGQTVALSEGTTVVYNVDDARDEVSFAPVRAFVDHLVGLRPDRIDLREGTPGTVTVILRNHRDEDDVFELFVDGIEPGISAQLPETVEVPAGQTVEVALVLTAGSTDLVESRYALRALSRLGGEDRVVGEVSVIGPGFVVTVEANPPRVYRGEEVTFNLRVVRGDGDERRGFTARTDGLAGVVSNDSEVSLLVDFLRGPVVERTFTRQMTGRAGVHNFSVSLKALSQDDINGYGTGQVVILDDHALSVRADPPFVRTGGGQTVTLNALITNEGRSWRNVTLDRCCGPAFWQPEFDPGPFLIAPGGQRRVPIRLFPNAILGGEYSHRLTVTDTEDSSITDSFEATVLIEEAGANLRMLAPQDVVAVDGEATLLAHLSRAFGSQGRPFMVAVDGPLGLNALYDEGPIDMSVIRNTHVPIEFRNLDLFGPGPWAVRVRAWPVADPSFVLEAFGSVSVESAGVTGLFEPAQLLLAEAQPTEALLSLTNHDHLGSARLSVRFEVDSEGVELTPASPLSLVLPPGGRHLVPLTMNPSVPGQYQVSAHLDPEEGEARVVTLELTVLDPADAPQILAVETSVDPEEGRAFELTVFAEDPNDDLLVYDFDVDGDGVFDLEGVPTSTLELEFPDDGEVTLAIAVRDPQGGQDRVDHVLVIANVAPSFVSTPPTEAQEGVAYLYEVETFDPGDDTVSLTLEGPAGAELSQGVLTWTPTRDQAMSPELAFTLMAADEDGGEQRQQWLVEVSAENQAPSAPTLIAPVGGAEVGSAQVSLEIGAASDLDGDALIYHYEVSALGQIVDNIVDSELVIGFVGTDGLWSWRARAFDGFDFGPFSPAAGFVIRAENRAPPAPEIVRPEPDSVVGVYPVEVEWRRVEDPDSDPLLYMLEVATDEDFEDVIFRADEIEAQGETIVREVTELVGGGRLHARVAAVDPLGRGPWSEVAFETQNRPPEAPIQLSPIDGQRVEPGPVALVLRPSADPDGHSQTCEVKVYADAELTQLVSTAEVEAQGQEVEVTFEAPEEPASYFWTATGIDGLGLSGPSAGPEEFNVLQDGDNAPPSAPTLVAPVDGASAEAGSVLMVFEAASDPNGDMLSHVLTVFSDAGETVLSVDGLEVDERAEVLVELVEPGQYQWTVVATDARGLEGPEAARESFLLVEPDPTDDSGARVAAGGVDAGCDCSTPGSRAPLGPGALWGLALIAAAFARRRP